MTAGAQPNPIIVLAGAGGDLGDRIARALIASGANVRVLVRSSASASALQDLVSLGADVDYRDPGSLERACAGAACVVSALNGLDPVILGTQGRLLDAAVAVGVPRFIPSDYSLDLTKTRPGDNRNLDLRRTLMRQVDGAPIRATSVLNGAFVDLLTGGAPIILKGPKKVL